MARTLAGTLRGLVFVALLGAAFAINPGGAVADAANGCKLAKDKSTPIGKACAEGGIPKAKQAMKDMIKAGKAKGVKFDCDDCHKGDDNYDQLTEDGKEKFKKLLAAAESK